MQQKILSQLADCFRGSSGSVDLAHEHALQVMAWAAISKRKEIAESDSLETALAADSDAQRQMIERLVGKNPVYAIAFDSMRGLHNEPVRLLRAMELCQTLQSSGVLAPFDVFSDAAANSHPHAMGIPAQLADLLFGLGNKRHGASIYVAWDAYGQLAERALHSIAKVHCDLPGSPAIASLVCMVAGGEYTIGHTDPVRNPVAVNGGKLDQFDVAIGIPPFGLRYDAASIQNDLFDRFPEKSSSGQTLLSQVLAVRHFLAVAKDRAVICAPSSLLFGAHAEHDLRKSLAENKQIEAVIGLPSGLLASANISLAVLVLVPKGGCEFVRFVSADHDRFRYLVNKSRARLTNIEALIALTQGTAEDSSAKTVSVREIRANNYQLQPNRYIVTEEQEKVTKALSTKQLVKLEDLVESIRPVALKPQTDDLVSLREVGASDLSQYGYVRTPQKLIEVDQSTASKLERQHLRPLDIIVTIKGSVGKVGIIPEGAGQGGLPWVVGQSSIALRVDDPHHINPKALFLLLRSSLGQTLIGSIVSGATIPLIQLRELMALQIPLFSLEEGKKAAAVLDQEARLQQQIAHLQEQQAQLSRTLWGDELASANEN